MAASKEGAKFMLLAVGFFSLSHASVKALAHLPFYELVFLRQLIALVICMYMIRRIGISPWGKNKKILVLRGLMGTTALACYFYSLHHMPLATAVTLQYLSPITTLIFCHLFLNEKASAKSWMYFALAFIGVLLVRGFDSRVEDMALASSLIAVFFAGAAYTTVRALKKSDHELVVVLYFPLVTLPIISPFAIYNWQWPMGYDWLFVAAVGGFTFLAQYFMTKAYQVDRAEDVGIFNYLGLVLALLYGYFFFGESFGPWSLIGMGLVILSVLLATGKRPKLALAFWRR